MNTAELVEAVKKAGGVLALEGDRLQFKLPQNAVYLLEGLRARKPEVIAILRARGGRVGAFPHCPSCASYSLYRRNNLGNYECQTCGLQEISEERARRVQ